MGSTGAQGFAELVDDGTVSLQSAIGWHMQSNHYPPHPVFMNEVALSAIELGNANLWEHEVELPDGVEWRDGSRLPTAAEVIESFHLEAFLRNEE
jgi:hypothetical protein